MCKLPNMNKPCSNCPFRKDTLKGWLGEDRMTEILNQSSFVCHKTLDKGDKNRRQCAGHMLLMEQDNEFVELANRMNIDLGLNGRELIFDTKEECIKHHKQS